MEQFINEVWKEVSVNSNYLVSNYGRVKTIDHPTSIYKSRYSPDHKQYNIGREIYSGKEIA